MMRFLQDCWDLQPVSIKRLLIVMAWIMGLYALASFLGLL